MVKVLVLGDGEMPSGIILYQARIAVVWKLRELVTRLHL